MFVTTTSAIVHQDMELAVGRSIQIKCVSGEYHGIVDFISACQGAHNIFVSGNKNERFILKIYSNRTMVELVAYYENKVTVIPIHEITVTYAHSKAVLHVNKGLTYKALVKTPKEVPVQVGDLFEKNGHKFEVLAVAKDGTMFLQNDDGKSLQVTRNDKTLIDAFNEFKWNGKVNA